MIWHDLVTMGIPIAEKAIRTAAVYIGIFLLLRFAGKRDLAQLNTLDFVVMLLLSNIVQNAVIGEDNSLLGGLLGAVILVALNAVLVRTVVAERTIGRLIEGGETTVVHEGEYDRDALAKVGLRTVDIDMALRRQNANDISQVQTAVLEPSGALVVTIKEQEQNATKADLLALEQRLLAALAR